MKDFQEGLLEAIFAWMIGFILNILVFKVFANIYPFIFLLYIIIIVIALISFLHEIYEWTTGFLLGWITGSFLMSLTGLLDITEIIISIIIPLFILILRIKSILD
jgi:hypothetical protein